MSSGAKLTAASTSLWLKLHNPSAAAAAYSVFVVWDEFEVGTRAKNFSSNNFSFQSKTILKIRFFEWTRWIAEIRCCPIHFFPVQGDVTKPGTFSSRPSLISKSEKKKFLEKLWIPGWKVRLIFFLLGIFFSAQVSNAIQIFWSTFELGSEIDR